MGDDLMKTILLILCFLFSTVHADAVYPTCNNGCGGIGYLDSCELIQGLVHGSKCFNDDECRLNCDYRDLVVYKDPPAGSCCRTTCVNY